MMQLGWRQDLKVHRLTSFLISVESLPDLYHSDFTSTNRSTRQFRSSWIHLSNRREKRGFLEPVAEAHFDYSDDNKPLLKRKQPSRGILRTRECIIQPSLSLNLKTRQSWSTPQLLPHPRLLLRPESAMSRSKWKEKLWTFR